MRVIMPAIIDQVGRSFNNADHTDGASGRDNRRNVEYATGTDRSRRPPAR